MELVRLDVYCAVAYAFAAHPGEAVRVIELGGLHVSDPVKLPPL